MLTTSRLPSLAAWWSPVYPSSSWISKAWGNIDLCLNWASEHWHHFVYSLCDRRRHRSGSGNEPRLYDYWWSLLKEAFSGPCPVHQLELQPVIQRHPYRNAQNMRWLKMKNDFFFCTNVHPERRRNISPVPACSRPPADPSEQQRAAPSACSESQVGMWDLCPPLDTNKHTLSIMYKLHLFFFKPSIQKGNTKFGGCNSRLSSYYVHTGITRDVNNVQLFSYSLSISRTLCASPCLAAG